MVGLSWENPNLKWMRTGGNHMTQETPIFKAHFVGLYTSEQSQDALGYLCVVELHTRLSAVYFPAGLTASIPYAIHRASLANGFLQGQQPNLEMANLNTCQPIMVYTCLRFMHEENSQNLPHILLIHYMYICPMFIKILFISMHAQSHKYVYKYVYIYVRMYMYMYVYIYIQSYIRIQSHKYIYIL